jgi:hypothetical protein
MTEDVPEPSDSTTVDARPRPAAQLSGAGYPSESLETLVGPAQTPPGDAEDSTAPGAAETESGIAPAVEEAAEGEPALAVADGAGDPVSNGQPEPSAGPVAEPDLPPAVQPADAPEIQPTAVAPPEESAGPSPGEPAPMVEEPSVPLPAEAAEPDVDPEEFVALASAEPEHESVVPEPVAATPVVDDGMWDALLVALATEPPIPADMVSQTPAPPAATDEVDQVAHGPGPVDDDFPSSAAAAVDDDVWDEDMSEEDVSEEGVSEEDVSEEDEVAAFWNAVPTAEVAAPPALPPTPPTPVVTPAPTLAPPLQPPPIEGAPDPWLAGDDEGVLGLRSMAAEWAVDAGRAEAGRSAGAGGKARETDGKRSPPLRRVVGPLAGRWATLRRGERVNVVLYALTGVSIVAMALELLAGPDSLPTDVSTAPAPAVSPTTTRPQSTTITFTIPPPAAEEPTAGPPATSADVGPARAAPTVAPADPEPEPEPEPDPDPTTAPPLTTTPATSPPTTRPTPPTSSGFPEPTLPVLPTFPVR